MLRLLPFLLIVAGAILWARLSMRRSALELEERSIDLVDPALDPALRRLAQALDVPRIRVRLYDVPAVNALAGHDGRLFLTRGFHDRFRQGLVSAEEIAGVIAHELGHVALGHSRRRMIDFTGQNAVRMGLGLVLGRLLGGVGVWVAQALAGMVAAGLSRRDEYEADAYATALLIKSGIGPGPQLSLFRKLGALTGGGSDGVPAWLLTHPRTEDRIRAIEANAARWVGGGTPPV